MRGYLAAAAVGLILGLIAGNRATAQGNLPGCPASPAPSVSVSVTPRSTR